MDFQGNGQMGFISTNRAIQSNQDPVLKDQKIQTVVKRTVQSFGHNHGQNNGHSMGKQKSFRAKHGRQTGT